jgi:hypothetical protein
METCDRYLYHPELAPDGKLFRAGTADPSEKGWVTTPAAFDPDYVAPPPAPPEERPVPGLPAMGPRVLFPSWRYHRGTGEARLVATAAEAGELGAEWVSTPADVGPPAPAPAPTAEETSARRTAFYALTVAEVTAQVHATDDLAVLDLWRSYEDLNPKGARKGVLAAITNRVNELE